MIGIDAEVKRRGEKVLKHFFLIVHTEYFQGEKKKRKFHLGFLWKLYTNILNL